MTSSLKVVPFKYIGFLKTANLHYKKKIANLIQIGNSNMEEMHLNDNNGFQRVESNFGRVLKRLHQGMW